MSTNTPSQVQGTPPDSSQQSSQWVLPYAKGIGLLILLYLIGPMTLLYAMGIRAYAAGSTWQAKKRWAQSNGSAFASLLWYVPIAFFHDDLASFWTTIFTTFAHWFHVPFLAWLGGTSIIPPLPSSLLLRWLLSLPLAGLLAILLEMIQPQTTWETKRIVTLDEQEELVATQAAQEKKKIAQEQRRLKKEQTASPASTDGTSLSPQRRPRTKVKPEEKEPSHPPKPDSLWGSIDWKTVPDTHPLKQAIRQEAEHLEAKRREDERNRWLTQQRATPQSTQVPSQIIDATLVPPTQSLPSPPTQSISSSSKNEDEDEYDWNEGEGSIQE